MERVCVTWLIFELENTSGANYVFILGRSSAVTLKFVFSVQVLPELKV